MKVGPASRRSHHKARPARRRSHYKASPARRRSHQPGSYFWTAPKGSDKAKLAYSAGNPMLVLTIACTDHPEWICPTSKERLGFGMYSMNRSERLNWSQPCCAQQFAIADSCATKVEHFGRGFFSKKAPFTRGFVTIRRYKLGH